MPALGDSKCSFSNHEIEIDARVQRLSAVVSSLMLGAP
jgi:hypothetical protein